VSYVIAHVVNFDPRCENYEMVAANFYELHVSCVRTPVESWSNFELPVGTLVMLTDENSRHYFD
jgi:hypothetical protein